MARDIDPSKPPRGTQTPAEPGFPTWDQIVDEIRELSMSGRVRAILRRGVEPDDLRQSVAVLLIEKLASDASVRRVFEHEDKRRAYIASCLHNIGRSMWRELNPARSKHRRAAIGDERQGREASPSDSPELVDLIASVLSAVQRDSYAWLAARVLTGTETLDNYASMNGISERTARRHLVLGTLELRALVQQQTES